MKNFIDYSILHGLQENRTLTEIMQALSERLAVDISLYSLSLSPVISVGSGIISQNDSRLFDSYRREHENARNFLLFFMLEENVFVLNTVMKNGNQSGLLVLCSPAGRNELPLLKYLSGRLAKLCGMMTIPDSSSSSFMNFENLWISNLILNTGSELQKNIPPAFFEKLRPGYAVCCFQPQAKNERLLQRAEKTVSEAFPFSLHVLKDNKLLVFLYRLDEKGWNNEALLGQIEAFSAMHRVYCGLSGIFDDIGNRNFFIRQANESLKWSLVDGKPAFADKNYCRTIIQYASEVWYHDVFIIQKLERILKYDRANNSNYFETLKTYLFCGQHINQASEKAYIDHSTMIYRLKRITELFDLDLSDHTQGINLRFGIRVLEQLNI